MKMYPSTHAKPALLRAFTLIEMLLVITIVSLLMALTVPVTSGIIQANQVTTAVQSVVDQLSLARQTAIAQNRVVEVRFYEFESTERMADVPEVAAFQTFIFDETNIVGTALGQIQHLPDGAVISNNPTYSSLLDASAREKTDWNTTYDPKVVLPRGIGTNYTAYSFRFRPDGSTDLGSGSWFLTLHGSRETASPPPNHAAIQVDPYNGALRLYRPG